MLHFRIEYDVRQTAQDGSTEQTTDEQGIYFYSGTLETRRAEALRRAHDAIPGLNGYYWQRYCEYSNPRIVREDES